MPRIRMVKGELVEEPLHHETVRASSASSSTLFPVALPQGHWDADPTWSARKRRGITGAADALRHELIRNGNADPGSEVCVARVADAVASSDRQSSH